MEKFAEQISFINSLKEKFGLYDVSFKKKEGNLIVDHLHEKIEMLEVTITTKPKNGYKTHITFSLIDNRLSQVAELENFLGGMK